MPKQQQPKTNIPIKYKKLKALREKLNLSQHEVESQAGITPGRLTQYECGRVDVTPEHLQKLLEFFKVTGPELVTREGLAMLTEVVERSAKIIGAKLETGIVQGELA